MLKQLAKMARTPPSPKNRAWMISATLTAMTAAHGPSTIATSVAAHAVRGRPAGHGDVEHHDREAHRAKIASSGIVRLLSTPATLRVDWPRSTTAR